MKDWWRNTWWEVYRRNVDVDVVLRGQFNRLVVRAPLMRW